ncbi:hypothetical protein BDY21DRAFT_395142 [Lineolata rhizophorae]|uniref:Uncharacterized protein n=1 Tax=Lineolata rhizophorae TaxID=578093 RepID=A0A6A6NVS7_9PEZI|nr:hypothetical protein BDY21DRAFT_395142 [Lineolata rhizophorae]
MYHVWALGSRWVQHHRSDERRSCSKAGGKLFGGRQRQHQHSTSTAPAQHQHQHHYALHTATVGMLQLSPGWSSYQLQGVPAVAKSVAEEFEPCYVGLGISPTQASRRTKDSHKPRFWGRLVITWLQLGRCRVQRARRLAIDKGPGARGGTALALHPALSCQLQRLEEACPRGALLFYFIFLAAFNGGASKSGMPQPRLLLSAVQQLSPAMAGDILARRGAVAAPKNRIVVGDNPVRLFVADTSLCSVNNGIGGGGQSRPGTDPAKRAAGGRQPVRRRAAAACRPAAAGTARKPYQKVKNSRGWPGECTAAIRFLESTNCRSPPAAASADAVYVTGSGPLIRPLPPLSAP